MSFDYIRRTYKVPAKRGQRVRMLWAAGEPAYGVIKSADGPYVRVLFDGDSRSKRCHPTWFLSYHVKGKWTMFFEN